LDSDAIAVAADDLQYLRDEWGDKISESALRRGSVTLRQLLIYELYRKAWREAGFEGAPAVVAPNLDRSMERKKDVRLELGAAGGGRVDGNYYAFVFYAPQGAAPDPRPEEVRWKFEIGKFLRSTALVFQNRKIPRQAIIGYVANKRGGGHLDHKRETEGFGPAYAILDNHADRMMMGDKNAVFYELMSIGQALANSADAAKLIEFRRNPKSGKNGS
jgi:hypothetical protein